MQMPTLNQISHAVPGTTAPPPRMRSGYDPKGIAWIDPDRAPVCDHRDADPLRGAGDSLAACGLALRPWRPRDAPALASLLGDARVWTHLPEPYPGPLDPTSAAELIRIAAAPGMHLVRAVIRDGLPIGQVRLEFVQGLEAGGGTAELSYWLGHAHWGRGYGRALVASATGRAFARIPGLLRLTAKVLPSNAASHRVLEETGFAPCPAPSPAFPGWHWLSLRRQDHRA